VGVELARGQVVEDRVLVVVGGGPTDTTAQPYTDTQGGRVSTHVKGHGEAGCVGM
jgi:hypothetical protein